MELIRSRMALDRSELVERRHAAGRVDHGRRDALVLEESDLVGERDGIKSWRLHECHRLRNGHRSRRAAPRRRRSSGDGTASGPVPSGRPTTAVVAATPIVVHRHCARARRDSRERCLEGGRGRDSGGEDNLVEHGSLCISIGFSILGLEMWTLWTVTLVQKIFIIMIPVYLIALLTT